MLAGVGGRGLFLNYDKIVNALSKLYNFTYNDFSQYENTYNP
jgi:hypothetical protein